MEHIIAIPVTEGVLSQHFGHCEQFYFARVNDVEILEEKLVTPPVHEPGLYPKWVKEQGADTVIAGGMGKKACDLFAQNGVNTFTGAQSQAPAAVVKSFLDKTIVFAQNTCANHEHKCE